MKFNVLTLPKISLGLFFILMMFASFYFSSHSIIYLFLKHWLIYLFLIISIVYLFNTAFKHTSFIDQYPITSFITLPISIIIFIVSFLLLNAIFTSDRYTYESIYMVGLIVLFFWVPIALAFFNFLDFLYRKKKNT
jgi:hypothetical protein